jgi:glycosyltransferase involved in cell wall biosynthesis
MLRVTIWMNMPSFYQGDFFRALFASREIDLQVVFAKELTGDRLQLGWGQDLVGYNHRFLSSRHPVLDGIRLAWSQRHRVHVVNGMWAEPAFSSALATLALLRSTYLIHSEAPEPDISRSLAKRFLRSSFGKFTARKASGVLCVSRLARDFFQGLGVPETSIYPFGYFRLIDQPPRSFLHSKKNGTTEIVFIGQLVRRKGVDILIEAMRPLFKQHSSLYLRVVGGGELHTYLQSLVENLGLTKRVIFQGVVRFDEVPARLATADLLVLPSRWDGWGLVVNEALSAGVPVIVSDRCGAADLIDHGVNGYVFHSEDVNELRECVSNFLEAKTDRSYLRANASEMGHKVSTEAAVPYFIACLKHNMGLVQEKPIPPWSIAKMAAQ